MSAPARPARPMVVIASSASDAAYLTPTVRKLVARGMRVDLVAGIDVDPRPLEVAVETYGKKATYVLCLSPSMEPRERELLELIVRSSEADDQRLISTMFSPDVVDGLVSLVWARSRGGTSGEFVAIEDPPAPDAGAPEPVARTSSSVIVNAPKTAPASLRGPPPRRGPASRRGPAPRRGWFGRKPSDEDDDLQPAGQGFWEKLGFVSASR